MNDGCTGSWTIETQLQQLTDPCLWRIPAGLLGDRNCIHLLEQNGDDDELVIFPRIMTRHVTSWRYHNNESNSLFLCAWAGPILISLRASCKSTLCPGSLLYVLQLHKFCKNNDLWCYNVI